MSTTDTLLLFVGLPLALLWLVFWVRMFRRGTRKIRRGVAMVREGRRS